MLKVNTNELAEETWSSPKGKFVGTGKEVSEALGRKPRSTDLNERHPFDVEIIRISPGKAPYPYHLHSAQWEFYHVISGKGSVRHKDGTTPIEAGDALPVAWTSYATNCHWSPSTVSRLSMRAAMSAS